MAESKVQKVARAAVVVKARRGSCGHEVTRAVLAKQKGRPKMVWWCYTCNDVKGG